jgi:hypothetical protein
MNTPCDMIDVSGGQVVNWVKAKAAGVILAYVKAGHGFTPDSNCDRHVREAQAAGVQVGVYWFWFPSYDPEKQADLLVEAHRRSGATLAPVCDVEEPTQISNEEVATNLMRVLLRVDAGIGAGQRCAIYTGPGYWSARFPGDLGKAFRTRMLWVAHYTSDLQPDVPFPWDEFALWQKWANTIWTVPEFTDARGRHHKAGDQMFGPVKPHPDAVKIANPGIVDGVEGEVDANLLGNASIADLETGTQPCTPLDYSGIRDRQRALRRLGFDVGKLDGVWGARCKAGLLAAQKKLGIAESGVWSAEVEEAIDITKQ